MPLPRIQDPSDEDEVQLLPIKSARSGRTLKPSATLKDPDIVANVLGQREHAKVVTKVVETTDQHKNKKQKTIVEPALVIDPNARTVAKPTDFSSTEMVMNKESGGITGEYSKHSSLGITITKRRNRLKGDVVEALQVVKCGLKTKLILRDSAPSSSYELELMDKDPEVPQTPGEVIDLSSDCELVEGESEVDIEYD
ncbi:hypothetical protein JB92DRAFT_3138242 [Gautieria morchelliformis]|nr:hypothetical protein JB92DRAFT_3138242 [Gautieria morchelliformis]